MKSGKLTVKDQLSCSHLSDFVMYVSASDKLSARVIRCKIN